MIDIDIIYRIVKSIYGLALQDDQEIYRVLNGLFLSPNFHNVSILLVSSLTQWDNNYSVNFY